MRRSQPVLDAPYELPDHPDSDLAEHLARVAEAGVEVDTSPAPGRGFELRR